VDVPAPSTDHAATANHTGIGGIGGRDEPVRLYRFCTCAATSRTAAAAAAINTAHQHCAYRSLPNSRFFALTFQKKILPSIVVAAADRCARNKDRATRCRPPARAGVQACRGARASTSKIPVVERRGWRPVHKRKAEDAWSCARRRRRRSCSSQLATRRPNAGSCHRGRELVARPKTAIDPAASRQRRPACPVRHAPPAPAYFYEHAKIRPARRSALHNTLFTARLESIFAHGQEDAALQRLRGLTPRHRLIMHTSHTATYTHTHTHTHTHTPTHTHTHTHTHQAHTHAHTG